MGRGKLEIKRIENTTNRQVTFSKRRNGIMKIAQELTVLCDAKVSIIIISGSRTKRLHHYISPGVELEKMYDEYQKIEGVDLWRKHYEQMQEHKRELLEDNNMLRREIRRRMGGYLEELTIGELGDLQQEMEDALVEIRNRKYHVIKNQTGTSRKKVKSLEEIHANLLRALEFGIVVDDDDDGGYEAASMYANNGPATASSNDMSHHNYHHQGTSLSCFPNFHDLHLA